jgi:hypothetical protein
MVMSRRLTKIADSYQNIRSFSLPRGWVLQTGILLCQLQAGSYAMKNRDGILTLNRKRLKIPAPCKRWRPKKKLVDLPAYSQAEAYGRRLFVQTYLEALANELMPSQAERIARMMYLLIFDKVLCGKSVHRLVARVRARGGIARAPIEAFATDKSVPHQRKAALEKARENR